MSPPVAMTNVANARIGRRVAASRRTSPRTSGVRAITTAMYGW